MKLKEKKSSLDELPDNSGNATKRTLKLKAEQVLAIAKSQNKKVLFLKQGQDGEFLKKLKGL